MIERITSIRPHFDINIFLCRSSFLYFISKPTFPMASLAFTRNISLRHCLFSKNMVFANPLTSGLIAAKPSPLSTYKSEWKRTTDVPLTRNNFLDLLYGKTPVIKETGFLSREVASKYEKELSPKLTPYKYYTGPLLTNVGVAQFEYQAQAAKDFRNRTDGTSSGLHNWILD
jgi:hypothetical protein